jgi:hypothetical protein
MFVFNFTWRDVFDLYTSLTPVIKQFVVRFYLDYDEHINLEVSFVKIMCVQK